MLARWWGDRLQATWGQRAKAGGLRYVTGARKGSREVTNHNRLFFFLFLFFQASPTDWSGSGGLLQPRMGYKMTIGSFTLVGRRVCVGRWGVGGAEWDCVGKRSITHRADQYLWGISLLYI